jgi:hypothetical protein
MRLIEYKQCRFINPLTNDDDVRMRNKTEDKIYGLICFVKSRI